MVCRTTLLAGLSFLLFIEALTVYASNPPADDQDFSRLLSLIELQDLQDPLVPFGAAEKEFDRRQNQENIAYLNQDQALIHNIQRRLACDRPNWRLNNSSKQLLVVPETRDEYALLFERYCRSAVDYLLTRIQRPSPYDRIVTIKGPLPTVPDPMQPTGMTAYLVHNLVDEYVEEYLFFSENDDQRKIKIKLSNRTFSGEIGSVTSLLKVEAENHFEFTREPYTVWQNSSSNPLDVFIVPIEETLHILMRPYTETALHAELTAFKPSQLDQVQQVVNDWMAVEEAIVGGVVWQVMPDILTRYVHKDQQDLLAHTLSEREELPRYRLLRRAIEVVTDLGVSQALDVYSDDPLIFKRMIDPATLRAALMPTHTLRQ
jgi:hypothetical protein